MRKLERQDLPNKYSEVIEEQNAAGVVESAEKSAVGREFYIPHKPVVRAEAEATKLRVVYDASARAYDGAHLSTIVCMLDHPCRTSCGTC